ncbi:hypothetical protein P8452_63488 [Trifolium repens]|nr:hypothetical protein P8452_63488 [Trifolium repens]
MLTKQSFRYCEEEIAKRRARERERGTGDTDRMECDSGGDGEIETHSFIRFVRGDQYAIALALLHEGKVVLGVLACPNLPPATIGSNQ